MTQDHKDQRAGLIVFGSLGIVAACFCGLFCLLYVAMAAGFMGEAARPSFSIFIQIMGFYGGAGLAFLWLGVGSILCRKWATALILACGWLWLICGAMGLIVMIAMQGLFDQTMTQAFKETGQAPPAAALLMIKVITFTVIAVIYFIVPAAIVAFYGRRATRLTCEARDPAPRWTDGIPLPAMVTAVMLSMFAYAVIVSSTTPAWPLFTVLLKGPAAHAATLALGLLLAFAAWGAFRLKPWAWWLGLLLPLVMMSSFAVFIQTAGVASYFDAFAIDAKQRKILEGTPLMEPRSWTWLFVIYPIVFSAFMLWVKRHFFAPASRGALPAA